MDPNANPATRRPTPADIYAEVDRQRRREKAKERQKNMPLQNHEEGL